MERDGLFEELSDSEIAEEYETDSTDKSTNINESAKKKKKDQLKRESLQLSSSQKSSKRFFVRKDGGRMSLRASTRLSDTSKRFNKKPLPGKKGKKARFFGEAEDAVEKDQEIPEGLIPIFLTIRTQEFFGLRIDEDVTDLDPQKFILKRDIMQDIADYGDSSDFISISKMIQDSTAEEFLIVYDHAFKYGQNFFIAVSEIARNMFVKDSVISDIEDYSADLFFGPYEHPQPQHWNTLGSEKEIDEWIVINQRDYIKMMLTRDHKYFGAPTTFSDSNPLDSKNFVDIMPGTSEEAELRRMEADAGVQAIPMCISVHTQKNQGLPSNKILQCKPREMSDEEAEIILQSPELANFFRKIVPRLDRELQQNRIINVFYDDWKRLCDEDTNFAAKSDKHFKEYQSFTDLQYGKSRAVSCITWHPYIPSIVAVSLIDNVSYYERIEQSHKQFNPPLILIWNFSDPIHPIMVLECPEQVMCFQFCPSNPSYVAGGCFNGQVVLWDLSYHNEKLKVLPGAKKKDILRELSAEFDWAKAQPSVRFCATSSMEHSHSMPITDIIWVPSSFEVNKFGFISKNKLDLNIQVMTCACDQSVLFWDIRMSKGHLPQTLKKDLENVCLTPTTFKHLHLVWKPFLKVSTSKSEVGFDYSPMKFSIEDDNPTLRTNGIDDASNQLSAIPSNPKPVSSKIFIGTEEGEVLYLDWIPQKDQESGKFQTQKPIFCHQVHDGPVMSLERSPFYEDVLLSVGGWNFAIWKEGVNVGPILMGFSPKRFTAGHWSTSRPSVLYLAKVDGTLDVWDLLDRTHEACYIQNISTCQLTTVSSIQISRTIHLLAVGDENGTLYLLELPWSLCNPSLSEFANMTAYIEKEIKHLAYVQTRWNIRDEERIKQDIEFQRTKSVPEVPVTAEEELEASEKLEYETFLEEEQVFLKQMGLIVESTSPPDIEKPVAA